MRKETLETFSRILGWNTVFGLLLVTLWFFGYMSGLLCDVHGRWFDFDHYECSILSYGGMGIMKMMVLIFFFVPWLAIRLELRKHRT